MTGGYAENHDEFHTTVFGHVNPALPLVPGGSYYRSTVGVRPDG